MFQKKMLNPLEDLMAGSPYTHHPCFYKENDWFTKPLMRTCSGRRLTLRAVELGEMFYPPLLETFFYQKKMCKRHTELVGGFNPIEK